MPRRGRPTEAGDFYRAAAAYGGADGRQIEIAVHDYVQSVITHEWPRMANAKSANATWDSYNALHRAIGALAPQDTRQTIWATQMVRDLAAVADARRDRLDQAANGLPALYWTIILLGTLVTMLYGGALLPRRANIVVICGLATAMGMVGARSSVLGLDRHQARHHAADAGEYERLRQQRALSREQLIRKIVMCWVFFGGRGRCDSGWFLAWHCWRPGVRRCVGQSRSAPPPRRC
jgi:hypothetical protein